LNFKKQPDMKKLTLLVATLFIAGATFACGGHKKSCCKKDESKKECCAKGDKKDCKKSCEKDAKKDDKAPKA
jgi:hypothetical protein